MAPTSVRAIFAYAGNFVSQLPFQLSNGGIPNPLAIFSPLSHDSPAASSSSSSSISASTTPYDPLSGAPSCPVDGPTSCHNQSQADSCCFVYPGGRLLLTQFWDEEVHVGGAEEDWTVHGLWPDLCDGSFDQYCGMAPRFNNITETLKLHGQEKMLGYMNRYWVAKYGTNDHLWAHEYNKHATCINTLAPSCYGEKYKPGIEVVDYFVRAFGLFKVLDTYRALQRASIEPDYKTYELSKIQKTLEEFSGGKVVLKCNGRHHNVLHEVWYVYFVKGSLQSGLFVPAQDSFKGDHGNCAEKVRYLPKRRKGHFAEIVSEEA